MQTAVGVAFCRESGLFITPVLNMDSAIGFLQHQNRYNYSLQQLRLLHPLTASYSGLLDPLTVAQLSVRKTHPFHPGHLGAFNGFVTRGADLASITNLCGTKNSVELSQNSDQLSDRPTSTDQGLCKTELIFFSKRQTTLEIISNMLVFVSRKPCKQNKQNARSLKKCYCVYKIPFRNKKKHRIQLHKERNHTEGAKNIMLLSDKMH